MKPTPLPIATDRRLVPPDSPHVTLLYPFWGRAAGSQLPRPDFAAAYEQQGSSIFTLGGLDDAAVAILPCDWKLVKRSPAEVEASCGFAKTALAAGATPVVFNVSDSSEPVPVPGALVVRTSLHRSAARIDEIAQPGFHEDLLEYVGGVLPTRRKSGPPVVGFCGVALAEQPPSGISATVRRNAGGHASSSRGAPWRAAATRRIRSRSGPGSAPPLQ